MRYLLWTVRIPFWSPTVQLNLEIGTEVKSTAAELIENITMLIQFLHSHHQFERIGFIWNLNILIFYVQIMFNFQNISRIYLFLYDWIRISNYQCLWTTLLCSTVVKVLIESAAINFILFSNLAETSSIKMFSMFTEVRMRLNFSVD